MGAGASRLGNSTTRLFSRLSAKVASASPLASKIFANAVYLRALLGRFYLLLLVASAALSVWAALQNAGTLQPPVWSLFIILAVVGVFDALAGAVGFVAFAVVSLAMFGLNSTADLAQLVAIAVIWFAPAMVARAFRSRRSNSATPVFEFVAHLSIAAFLTGWIAASAVSALPAIAGKTLAAANHAADFGLAVALAIVIRLVIEEVLIRRNPELDAFLAPTELPKQSWISKIVNWLLRWGLFTLVAGSIFGFSGYVIFGAFLFVLPIALNWFADRVPNSVLIWKMLPTGLPGLNLVLLVSGFTAAIATQAFPTNPGLVFMLLPLPLLLLAILALFGRHGKPADQLRPVHKPSWRWLYQIGGVIMFVVALQLTGII